VALGGEDSTSAVGARKRLATSALSPVPQVSADSDTAKLQELVLASIPKEVVEGVKDVKELSAVVKSQGETILQHAEIIRILRGTAMEQDNRLQAALIKLNLTIAATDKLDDAVELIEVDQAAVVSDFKELKTEVAAMKHVIESKEVEQDDKLTRLVEQRHLDVHGLTKELQEKMATVESTFVKVEQLLFAMNGDREKYALMAAGMHDLVASTGAVVPPSTTSVDIAALKIRTAQTAECTNDVKEAVDDVQQKVVSMEVNMQGAVAHRSRSSCCSPRARSTSARLRWSPRGSACCARRSRRPWSRSARVPANALPTAPGPRVAGQRRRQAWPRRGPATARRAGRRS